MKCDENIMFILWKEALYSKDNVHIFSSRCNEKDIYLMMIETRNSLYDDSQISETSVRGTW